MVTKHLQEGSSQNAPRKPSSPANGRRPCHPDTRPLHFQQCGHCRRSSEHQEIAEYHRADHQLADRRAPLILTLGSPVDHTTGNPANCMHICSCDTAPATTPMSALRGSPFLKPAQELLNEVVSMKDVIGDDEIARRKHGDFGVSATHQARRFEAAKSCPFRDNNDGVQMKLLSLLNELESRYEQYFHQLGQVVSSFESALGAGATAWYTSLMAQAMSRHFANLRHAILRKLHSATTLREDEDGDDEAPFPGTPSSNNKAARQKRRTVQAEQVWRPLRGLPEDSVAVLRAWLFEHFLHPYPSDNEKLRLAVSTGLSRNQISNWFINARVRLWKPMIEEMYNEEFSEDSREMSGASS